MEDAPKENRDISAFAFEGETSLQRGLTKREYAAIHILASMVSDPNVNHDHYKHDDEDLVHFAVQFADMLFKKLEETT